MTLIGRWREASLLPGIRTRAAEYQWPTGIAERRRWQLDAFNRQWAAIRHSVPFYADLSQRLFLPVQFSCWEQILEQLPVVDRSIVQQERRNMWDRRRPADWWRTTGGSTSQPVQLPAWHAEIGHTNPNTWLGRSWYGIRPADRLFLIWGHSHLLGSGLAGQWRAWKRQWQDRLLGYYRHSAYLLSESYLRAAGRALLRFRPEYCLGYSVALDAFARANAGLASDLRRLGLKAIIGAAERFPSPESITQLSDLFEAPVGMEYGSAETGLIAHTQPAGGYVVFWRSYFVEALEPFASDGRRLRVTALFPRAFPLLRYELGDAAVLEPEESGLGATRLARVIGRCNESLPLPDGTAIHSEAMAHVLRGLAGVSGYQVVQQADRTLRLRLTLSHPLGDGDWLALRGALSRVHAGLSNLPIDVVEQLSQNIAGKTPFLICLPASCDASEEPCPSPCT